MRTQEIIIKMILSKKESLFLIELANILLKYDAVLQCSKNGNQEILVFEKEHEEENTFTPIEFLECIDETDIEALLKQNGKA